jgi:hypothetical protein
MSRQNGKVPLCGGINMKQTNKKNEAQNKKKSSAVHMIIMDTVTVNTDKALLM